MSKRFIVLGMGYVAENYHMDAIKSVDGDFFAFLEPYRKDLGWIQKHFERKSIKHFKEIEILDREVFKQRLDGTPIDYCSILTPNYLHEPQARIMMRNGVDCIVEKPLCTSIHNLDPLKDIEEETGKRIYPVLQLRHHEATEPLREKCATGYHKVKIDYSSYRTDWYFNSWKNNESKSGGLIVNIGIHLVDLAVYLFGNCHDVYIFEKNEDLVSGCIELERAHVEFRLSIRVEDEVKRCFDIDGELVDFSDRFTKLHNKVYEEILAGRGFGIEDAREAVRICQQIREYGQHEHRRCA